MKRCKDCGCTPERACEGGCIWILPNVCSACAIKSLRAAGMEDDAVVLGELVEDILLCQHYIADAPHPEEDFEAPPPIEVVEAQIWQPGDPEISPRTSR